jgi:allophanate hydrolase
MDMPTDDAPRAAAIDSPFTVEAIRALYRGGKVRAAEVVRTAYERIRRDNRPGVWIALRPESEAIVLAERLPPAASTELPLYGIPFAVKDNIDVSGLATTAACPAFAHNPAASAESVRRLEAAGAICIGKTNLDQFATGLCGVRSPYGACGAASHPDIIAGGSSSGSAVAVALEHVAFSLGTDTGGSGRIPAAFNGVVGLKPTIGVISTRGLVPNCRTLDCVSVFTHTVADAVLVAEVMRGFDEADPFSRRPPDNFRFTVGAPQTFRFGVPRAEDLEFFGNPEAPALFADATRRLEVMGGTAVPVDFAVFREAGTMMFDGPWVAERVAAIGDFVAAHADDVLPVIRSIFATARQYGAVDTFVSQYRREALKRQAEALFTTIDVLAVPTVATWFTIAEMEADPVSRNTIMGYYSYFVNMLDLCAVAVPNDFYLNGLPAGITLIAPAFDDSTCATIASRFQGGAGIRRANAPSA